MKNQLKQKQIEEMKKHIQNFLSGVLEIEIDKLAEELIKHYQPKIHENVVVLTREEFDQLTDNKLRSIGIIIEGTRKQTAERYHAEIEKAIYSVPNATKEFVQAWKDKNDEIRKEITEGKV